MKLQREVTQIATVQESNMMVAKTAENLEALTKKAANTQDIKDSQDIANAINIEMAQLQVVSMKMDMLEKQNVAQEKAEEEQKKRKQAMLSANGQGNHLNVK
jgi:type IV secretion system protein VirB5